MKSKSFIIGSIASLGFLLGVGSGSAFGFAVPTEVAQMSHDDMQPTENTGGFQRIEQPLWVKGAVTAGGLGLIGLELWWFLFSKPKSRKATTEGGIQEITVTVDGGYEPSQIVVQAGKPVRLNFDRKDPSSCLEEVRFPDFRIAQELPLNQVTAVEFTPDKPGRYEFTCGMNMFRGVVEAQAGEQVATAPPSPQSIHLAEQATHSTNDGVVPAPSVEATFPSAGIQEAAVTVAKGYQPKRVIVEAGYPFRLRFDRQNPSSQT